MHYKDEIMVGAKYKILRILHTCENSNTGSIKGTVKYYIKTINNAFKKVCSLTSFVWYKFMQIFHVLHTANLHEHAGTIHCKEFINYTLPNSYISFSSPNFLYL